MDVGLLATLATSQRAWQYCQVAAATVAVHDHLVTIGAEVDLIWKHPWSFPKILYIFNRYFGNLTLLYGVSAALHDSTTSKVSHVKLYISTFYGVLCIIIAQLILQTRIYALYRKSRILLYVLGLGFAAEAATVTFGGFTYAHSVTMTPLPLPGTGYHFCLPQGLPSWISYLYFPVLGFETVLMVLTLTAAVKHIRNMAAVGQWTRNSIISILVRDSVFYFVLLVSTYIAALLVIFLSPINGPIPLIISNSTQTILCNRLLLDLRKSYHKQSKEVVVSRVTDGVPLSVMIFRETETHGAADIGDRERGTKGRVES